MIDGDYAAMKMICKGRLQHHHFARELRTIKCDSSSVRAEPLTFTVPLPAAQP
ncbi:hypothetical protein PO909_003034 [Leuciscus waleckii]